MMVDSTRSRGRLSGCRWRVCGRLSGCRVCGRLSWLGGNGCDLGLLVYGRDGLTGRGMG